MWCSDDFQVTDSVRLKGERNLPAGQLYRPTHLVEYSSCRDQSRFTPGCGPDETGGTLPDAAQYEPYVLREYLVYKIYNIITPLSLPGQAGKVDHHRYGKG